MSLIADIHRDLEKGALQLLMEYRERLLDEALKLCGDAARAEDLVFQTIERVLAKSDSYRTDENLFGWMKTILENLYRNEEKRPANRRMKIVDPDELEGLAGLDFSAEDRILRNSDGEAVRVALGKLDPKDREILVMRFYEDLTLEQIAACLNCPTTTVWRRMQVAIKLLAGKLEVEFGKAKPKLALLGAFLLAGSLFAAATVGIVEAVNAVGSLGSEAALESEEPEAALESEGTLGSLESEGSLGSVADPVDPNSDPIVSNVPNSDPKVPKDANSANQLSTTENNNTEKEENMNIKSITKSAAKLAVGAALTTGLAAVAQAGWTLSSSTSITDGNWVLTVTASGTELSVTGVTSVGDATTLDLSAAVTDGGATTYTIVSIGGIATTATKPVLATVILPETLRIIGKSAFLDCAALKTVTPFLPAALTSLGASAFCNCPVETPLVLSNPALTSILPNIKSGMFKGSRFPSADLSQSSVATVGRAAFQGNTALKTVVLPETVTTIEQEAFSGCTALKTVTPFLPATVTSLGISAFLNCPIETPLVLSNPNFTTIFPNNKSGMFLGSRFPSADLSQSGITTIGRAAFQNNTMLKMVSLPVTLTEIGQDAFSGCTALDDVYFLSDVPTFGGNAFAQTVGDYKGRFRYPAVNVSWLSAGTEYVAWDSVDEVNRQKYVEAFDDGTTPVGAATFGAALKCLVPVAQDVGDRVDVVVRGEPVEVGVPEPGYGAYEDVGQTIAGSVSQFGDDGRIWYESRGYRIDRSSAEGWVPGEEVPGERTMEQKVDEGGVYGLVWLWATNGYQVVASDYNSDYGSVTQTTADYGDSFYEIGRDVTLTAVPVSGVSVFDRWYGDVPAGQEHNATITVKADGIRTLQPVFISNWAYDSTTSTITDGSWTLNVSGAIDALTVTGVKSTVGGITVLDLDKAVSGSGTIVAIGAKAFSGAALTEVRLPETLATIGNSAFSDCAALKTVTPFLPAALTSLGASAFCNCPIETPLVLSNPEFTSILPNAKSGMFKGSRFPSADLSQSGITTVGRAAFQNNTALRTVMLPETVTTIEQEAFSGCTALATVTPFLSASVTSLGISAFLDCPIETPLVLSNPSLTSIPANYGNGVFKGSRFPSADLSQSGITLIGRSSFYGNSALVSVRLPKELSTIEKDAFASDSSLLSVDFKSLPTIAEDSFNSAKGLPARFTYSAGDADWAAFIATSTESGALKLWKSADVTQAERDAYLAEFPATPKPVGKMSIGGSMKWLVPVGKVGMMLIFK